MSDLNRGGSWRPLLLQFGERLRRKEHLDIVFRYNHGKQLAEAFLNGSWVEAMDLPAASDMAATRETKVRQETTDDD
jgi:hypothetical protein